MIVSIWNYFRGYVMIEVSGFSVERFLNLVAHRNIYIWDIERKGNKTLMKVSIKGFKMLKPCARKTACRIKIRGKYGFPFISYKYRKRKMIPLGMLVFILILYFISSFVWLIEVNGNKIIASEEILELLSDNGYKIGKPKNKMDLRLAEQILMRDFTDILWTGISFEGTKLIINITETVAEPKMADNSNPVDIVANTDALILEIVTRKGTPMVKRGDTVRKGDILVSGKIKLNDEWEEEKKLIYTRASADILAKTYYSLTCQLPLNKTEKQYTDKSISKYTLRIIDKNLDLYNPNNPFENYDYTIQSKQLKLTSKFPLPIYIVSERYIEYIPQNKIISDESAQDTLIIMLSDLLNKEIHKEGEVIRQEVKFVKKDDIMIARLKAIVKEELGRESKVVKENGRNKVDDNKQSEY